MADKEVKITMVMVLKVDLNCKRCNKKIRKVLHKIKDKMNIETTSFSQKKSEVTISGPFDAEKVRRKLCCEAGGIMKVINVMEERPQAVVPRDKDDIKIKDINLLRPLLEKMMIEGHKARPQPGPCRCSCGCSCGKQTTQPPAQGVPMAAVTPSVWPAPASSVYGHGHEAPSYYGVPMYSIEGWY